MSTLTQLICHNFGGIRQKNAVFSEEIITAQDLQNVELYYTGINNGVGIRTVKGNISINDSLVDDYTIVNIFESVQQGKKYFFIHAETTLKGTLYSYDKSLGTMVVLKDNLTVTGNSNGVDVIQGWSDLFFFTNGTEMFTVEMDKLQQDQVTRANEIVDMNVQDSEGRTVLGLGCAVFANRLFIFSGNLLWYSVTANIYDFSTSDADWETSAGYIELLKNVTAIHPYLDSLAIFYSDSSALLSVKNGVFAISEESPGGCAGLNALVFHDTNLYFYDNTKKAVFSFKQVISGQKTLGENVAIDIQNILLNIDENNLDKIKALSVFLEGRNEIWWLLPTTDDNYSTILIYDYLKGEWIKRKSQKINCVRIVDNLLYSGANDGNILEEYNSDTFNGEYIQHYYNCSPCNLGAMNTLKILVFQPRVSFDFPYSNTFYVKYVKNYNTFKKPRVKLIKSKIKNFMFWDIGFWDKDYWASRNTNIIGKFPNATFKILEISIYTENSTQNFAIKNIEFSKIKVKQV